MPLPAKKKAKPVPVSTPVATCEVYMNVNEEMKACKATLDSMKKMMTALIPNGRIAMEFAATREGKLGQYIVKEIEQDRRVVDNEVLTELLIKKNLLDRAGKVVADQTKVAGLVADGSLTTDDIAECLRGPRYSYPLVEFRQLKDLEFS